MSHRANVTAVVNQKGGTGKTCTAENLGVGMAMMGQKVLLIDLDPQGSLTISMGHPRADELNPTISTMMEKIMNEQPIGDKEGILTHPEGVDLMPANIELSGLEMSLINVISRETILKQYIDTVNKQYDQILIDCSPSLGLITVNTLTAADSVIIPVQCEYFALEGLGKLLNTLQIVQSRLNPSLEIEGFLLTMYNGILKSANQVVADVRKHFGAMVFNTMIARNVRLSEAPSHGKPVILYDAMSAGANNYLNLAKELLSKNQCEK